MFDFCSYRGMTRIDEEAFSLYREVALADASMVLQNGPADIDARRPPSLAPDGPGPVG